MLNLLSEEQREMFESRANLIKDSYHRMATNRCFDYRKEQMMKCEKWLEEMTKILEDWTNNSK